MKNITSRNSFFLVILLLFLASCQSSKTTWSKRLYDPVEVAQLSNKLGISLNNTDVEDDRNMPLYAEVSLWLGTKYCTGGATKKCVDCSGFVTKIYQNVYGMNLPRTTSQMSGMKMQKISKNNLRAGDLIFFATSKSHSNINHIGIYLKNGRFVHASTTRGVVVDNLDQDYYKKAWRKAGRVR
ncbi:C40 family peptidase [Dysgonomonas sp. 511]|uniref:C40 family peptidase n=1 Tax=Dysgonomonas sp. 511 TaxID=2302930 RepID=UPI0013D609DF|nr:NlpC/P60 family protein [Dysgonomonas sp. 511]NDV79537.1 NlpC/P60 family protein [Dysgonomonas sp. 511]